MPKLPLDNTNQSISKRPLLALLAAGVIAFFVFRPSASSFGNLFSNEKMSQSWTSPREGWISRTVPSKKPETFTPTREDLVFGLLRNAPVDTNGFTLAVFKGAPNNIVVNAMGEIHELVDGADWERLVELLKSAAASPDEGGFPRSGKGLSKNQWAIHHGRTSLPIERLLIKEPVGSSEAGTLTEVSLRGFTKEHSKLDYPVGEYETLPSALWELFGLVLEGRQGYEKGKENAGLIESVKNILREGGTLAA